MAERKPLVMVPTGPSLLRVYSRNLELWMTKKGWTPVQLSKRLGVTQNTLSRIRFNRSRYIDPEVFEACLRVFACEPNDLLLAHPDIDYDDDE